MEQTELNIINWNPEESQLGWHFGKNHDSLTKHPSLRVCSISYGWYM